MVKDGDSVSLNDNYYVDKKHKDKVYTCASDSYIVCGTEVILLKELGCCYLDTFMPYWTEFIIKLCNQARKGRISFLAISILRVCLLFNPNYQGQALFLRNP